MIREFPPNDNHIYYYVEDWNKFINELYIDYNNPYSIVFIDSSPWESRIQAYNHFKNSAEYILIHDVDYFPNNNIFGKKISNDNFDFSDIFTKWALYYPEKPWPSISGPPTLVGTNTNKSIFEKIEY